MTDIERLPMPECVLEARAITAESPVWDDRRGVFFWTDIPAAQIHRFDIESRSDQVWDAPEQIGALALTREGDWILLAGERTIWSFRPETGEFAPLIRAEMSEPELRFNDGRVDQAGNFWVGSLVARDWPAPDAGLYRLSHDWMMTRADRAVFTSNGLALSPDGARLYHADSRRRTIWRQHLDPNTGELSSPVVDHRLSPDDGVPDGASVDEEGGYWIAVFGGWRVCRILDGQVVAELPLPVANPTMCGFGGPDRRTLLITTGSRYFTAEDRAKQPLAGGLFMRRLDLAGVAEHRFAGSANDGPLHSGRDHQ